MLSLEACDLESAIEKYLEYVGSARLIRGEPIEDDEKAQGELASDPSGAFDGTVHSHSHKIEKLSAMDFAPKSKAEEGGAAKLGGRFFVIAVSTGKFVCDGDEIMSISTLAPIYAELKGKRVGDADLVQWNGARDRGGRLTAATPKVESCPSAKRTATVANLLGVPKNERMPYGTAWVIFPSLP
jgi:hypothetical protein